jgi:hypothetical protein
MSVNAAIEQRLRAFVADWKDRTMEDRSTIREFLTDWCRALGTAAPDGVDFRLDTWLPGSEALGPVDVYKRGHFVMHVQQARAGVHEPGDAPLRSSVLDYAAYIRSAYVNLVRHHRRLGSEAVPLVIVVDVGHMLWIWPAFAGQMPDFWSRERIALPFAALAEPRNADLLRACFEQPARLDRRVERRRVSEALATRLATLARGLEQRHGRAEVADFVMRVLFCMFAEAVGLLPEQLMAQLCKRAAAAADGGVREFGNLFVAMRTGGRVYGHEIERFGSAVMGERVQALALVPDELALVSELCELDWQHLDPAIFGTLLEQALDERERWTLGAHYTPREHVERLVAATLEPLEQEWRARQAMLGLRAVGLGPAPGRTRLRGLVREVLVPFHQDLVTLRVLDPACGTGNFLIVAYQRLAAIELEYRTLLGELLGEQLIIEEALAVVPDRFIGLEKNAWAAEIAQLVLFLGHVQVWLDRTGVGTIEPTERGRRQRVLAALTGCSRSVIVCDALLDDAGARTWPAADYIVGNPPYIGNKQLREALGSGYVERLRASHPDLPRSIDLVMYWWVRAARLVAGGQCRRMGMITTSSVRQVQNRAVVRAALDGEPPLRIAWALPDHPWVEQGAQVRIAMLVVERIEPDLPPARLGRVVVERASGVELAFEAVEHIHADLQAAHDLESAEPLDANAGVCFQGMNLVGKDGFVLTPEQVVALGYDPDALPSVIRPYLGGREFLHARPAEYVIDAYGLDEHELADAHPRLHAHLRARVWPLRKDNARAPYRARWWVFGEPRTRLRSALAGRTRYIVTNETARQRTFEFVEVETVPDHQLYVVASDDPFVLGVLLSLAHRSWALALGGRQGVGNDPRYNGRACFSTFPFPDPPLPLRTAIAELALELDTRRKLLRREDPSWTLAKIHARLDAMQADGTMLELRWAELLDLVVRLDLRVGEAYGLEPRGDAWSAAHDEGVLLGHLLRLNHERRREERAGRVRWLRPDLIEPGSRVNVLALDDRRPRPRRHEDTSGPLEWPSDTLGRLRQLGISLARASRPLPVADLCRSLHNARPKTVERLLDMLDTLGYVERVETGWRACE